MFFLMYLLLAVLAQEELELRGEEIINFSVCCCPWLLDCSYCGLDIYRAGNGHPAAPGDVICSPDVLS